MNRTNLKHVPRESAENYPGWKYQQVVVVTTRTGKTQWGFQVDESPFWVRIAFPLPTRSEPQLITIPWVNVDSICTEDEDGAPWSPRKVSP